ncbi:hypothetical protein Pint_36374 [Pistacia integerrima]|uniref:Uncharacterized protein n=1 Tax=Pistacia integerrima TaxID=434235 RepID=A0ACC0Y244_9ROSI|nr:hypothetical protein Pint_36374 [Pistacia integerrima]
MSTPLQISTNWSRVSFFFKNELNLQPNLQNQSIVSSNSLLNLQFDRNFDYSKK